MPYSRDYLDILPFMASNTNPGPTVVSDSVGGNAFIASNKEIGLYTGYDWGGAGNPSWWKVDLGPYCVRVVNKYGITGRSGTANDLGYCPSAWTLKGSNDDVEWDVIDSQSGISWVADEQKFFLIPNTTAYRYYKFDFTATQIPGRNAYLREIEFFDVNDPDAVDLTPAMTANDAPSPNVVSAQTENNGAAFNAFNDGVGMWGSGLFPSLPHWIKYDFGVGNEKVVNSYNLVNGNPDNRWYHRGDFKLQGSNNDVDWVDLDVRTAGVYIANEKMHYAFMNETAYRYYRLLVSALNGGSTYYLTIGEMELYEGTAAIPPDTEPPDVTITGPTEDPTYATNDPLLGISGTASDDVGVTEVAWSNDRGGSGVCTGTTSWSADDIALVEGQNIITVTGKDAADNEGEAILTVTYAPPDTEPPDVTITGPTSDPTYLTHIPLLDISGEASDDVGVTEVVWENDRGGNGLCTGTESWFAEGIVLKVGQNVITVTGRDAANNEYPATLTVTYTPLGGASAQII